MSTDDKIVFYNIELEHLNDLKNVAQKLTAHLLMEKPSLGRDEIRQIAFKVATVVNYAEVLHTFRNSGKPVCRICGPFLLNSCPEAPRHDLRTPEKP